MNKALHRLFLSALALTALVVLPSMAHAKLGKGDRAPAFVKVVNGAGKKVSLKTYKKQIVVLTFGASWCAPCKKELPAFEKLAKKFDADKVVFLAVNIDKSSSKGKAFMKKAGLKLVKALYDPKSSTVESYDPATMPTTFIIKRGIIKSVHSGYRNGDDDKLQKVIEKEL